MGTWKSHNFIRKSRIRQKERCAYCGTSISWGVKTHLDHVIARCLGGTKEDRLLTCVRCNMAKGGGSLEELMEWFMHIRSNKFRSLRDVKEYLSVEMQRKIKTYPPLTEKEMSEPKKEKVYSEEEQKDLIRKALKEDNSNAFL